MILPASRTPHPSDAPALRWGVLGTGWIADRFVEAMRAHTRQRLMAVGSRTQARADEFVARHGAGRAHPSYEALVADPEVEIVYVATPHSEHRANALLAIEAGKHVLVEKAFTRDAAEAREVIGAAHSAGVAVMEAMWTRFLPHMDVIRQLLDDGSLGALETVIADHGQWFPEDAKSRLFDPALAGGAMLDLGVYPVSFANFVLGAPTRPLAVGSFAFTGVDRQVSAVLDGHAAYPHAHALVTTTLAALTPTTATISGDLARVEVPGPFYCPQRIVLQPRVGDPLYGPEPTITWHEALCYEAAHFATLVAEGRTESEIMPLSDTLAVMETMDELRRQVGALPGE